MEVTRQDLGDLAEQAVRQAADQMLLDAWDRGFTAAVELTSSLLSAHGHLGAVALLDQALAATEEVRHARND